MDDVRSQEVEAILEKLDGHAIPHVEGRERRAAVERAVRQLNINASHAVQVLLDVIGTNEGQLAVHSKPSDPDEDD